MTLTCGWCDKENLTFKTLNFHLHHYHEDRKQEYYDEFMRKEEDGKCIECDNPTQFKSLKLGYGQFCSDRCRAIVTRRKLKEDPEKFKKFREKVVVNMTREWHTKDQSVRKANVRKTVLETNARMSDDERKERYDTYSKLSPEEKKERVRKMCHDKGFCKWWSEASEEDKRTVIDKRAKSLSNTWDERGNEIIKKIMDTFLDNQQKCRDMTELSQEEFDRITLGMSIKFGLDIL